MKAKFIQLITLCVIVLGGSTIVFSQVVVTSVGSQVAVPGSTVMVPVTIANATTITAISLNLKFEPGVLTYLNYQNPHPSLSSGILLVNPLPGKVALGWFSINPVSFGNGILLNYVFNYSGGFSYLIWEISPVENCQYGGTGGNPIPGTFNNGSVNPTASTTITVSPVNQNKCVGQQAVFSVTAPGGTVFKWQLSTNLGGSWTYLTNNAVYAGATTPVLTVSGVTNFMNNYLYRCLVNQGQPTAAVSTAAFLFTTPNTLHPATLIVNPGTTICPSTPVDFTVSSVAGIPDPVYSWYLNGVLSGNNVNYSTSSLVNGNVVSCNIVSATSCHISSIPSVAITVIQPPLISSPPSNAFVQSGNHAVFTVGVSGSNTFRWQESVNGGIGWNDLADNATYSGTFTASMLISAAAMSMNGNQYRCVVTESVCAQSSVSAPAVLTVWPSPIYTSAATMDVCQTGNIVVPVTVENFYTVASISLTLNYDPAIQSYTGFQNLNTLLASGFPLISSNGSQVLMSWFSMVPANIGTGTLVEYKFHYNGGNGPLLWDAASGSCMYTNSAGDVLQAVFTDGAILNPVPEAFHVNGGGTYCNGGAGIPVGLDTSETGVSYQLYRNGSISGSTITGTGAPVSFGNQTAEGVYTVSGSNSCGSTTMTGSVTISLMQVDAGPDKIAIPGIPVTLNASVSGGAQPYSFSWLPASGLSNPSILNPVASPVQTTTYFLYCTDQTGCTCVDSVKLILGGSLSGSIKYLNSLLTPMANMKVFLKNLSGQIVDSSFTNQAGMYVFPSVANGSYYIVPACTKPWNGGNAADALMMLKHYIGLITITGLKEKAAKLDGDNFITAADALLVVKRYLAMVNSFPAGDWVFEKDMVTVMGNTIKDIKGLCFGDVDGSYFP